MKRRLIPILGNTVVLLGLCICIVFMAVTKFHELKVLNILLIAICFFGICFTFYFFTLPEWKMLKIPVEPDDLCQRWQINEWELDWAIRNGITKRKEWWNWDRRHYCGWAHYIKKPAKVSRE